MSLNAENESEQKEKQKFERTNKQKQAGKRANTWLKGNEKDWKKTSKLKVNKEIKKFDNETKQKLEWMKV